MQSYAGTEQLYIGRFSRGQSINLTLSLAENPDDSPVIRFWLTGTTNVLTVSMPIIRSRGVTFYLRQYLSDEFTDGCYAAVISYDIDAATFTAVRYFEVQGGDASTPVISILEIDRALGRGIVTQQDDGLVKIGYKPRSV